MAVVRTGPWTLRIGARALVRSRHALCRRVDTDAHRAEPGGHDRLWLQRTAGNQAVSDALCAGPGDGLERTEPPARRGSIFRWAGRDADRECHSHYAVVCPGKHFITKRRS